MENVRLTFHYLESDNVGFTTSTHALRPECARAASDVRLIVSTNLTDAEISGIITMSDAEIDRRIGAQDSSDKLVKKLCMLLSAHTIKTRQPGSQAIGARAWRYFRKS